MLNTLRLWNCVGFCGIIGRCQSVSPYPLPLQGLAECGIHVFRAWIFKVFIMVVVICAINIA